MNDPMETKQCSNCKLDILPGNYTTHSLHCVKNIYLCDKCEQPVNYIKKLEHDLTNHAVVGCTNCSIELERYLIRHHLENNCCKRKVKCPICDIELIASDISEHEDYCGSRTEKCSGCGKFIMLKYKSQHIDSNHNFTKLSDEPGPSPFWQNGKRTLYNFMPDLSPNTSEFFPDYTRQPSKFSDPHYNSPCVGIMYYADDDEEEEEEVQHTSERFSKIKDVRASPRKSVDEWPALTSLRSLQISEEKTNEYSKPEASNFSPTEDSDLEYEIQVCEKHNSLRWFDCPHREHKVSRDSSEYLAENHFSGEKIMEKNLFDERNKKQENAQWEDNVSGNNLDYFYEQENIQLPCEFCGSQIIPNELLLHQSRCALKVTEPYNRAMHGVFYYDENDEGSWGKNISCGFCNKVFKPCLLDSHELYCKGNPTKAGKNQDKESYSRKLRSANVKFQSGIQNGTKPNSCKLNRAGTHSEGCPKFQKPQKEK